MSKLEETLAILASEDIGEDLGGDLPSGETHENDATYEDMLVQIKRRLREYVYAQGLPLCEGLTEKDIETFLSNINV